MQLLSAEGRVKALALIGLLLVLTQCAELVRRSTASADEYQAYRRYRTASSVEDKLRASFDYLSQHPKGSWRAEVRAWFLRAEDAYVDAAWEDTARLRAFLDAVPKAPHASAAAERIVELDLTAKHRARREQALDAQVDRVRARLEAAEQGRRRLVADLVTWVKRLLELQAWGMRTHELPHEFIFHYRLEKPEARCGVDRCNKTITAPYAIPEDRALGAREAVYDVVLELRQGGLARAMITGPELFSRLTEAVELRAISPHSVVARTEALSRAELVLSLAIEPSMPQARCGVPAVSPALLERRCDGSVLRVVAGVEAGEEDRIVLEVEPGGSHSQP